MKLRVIWVVAAFLCLGSAGAGERVEGYNLGNAHFRKGDFEAAIAAYKQVVSDGFENADVFYNLGNAFFKAGQLGRAILWYERALKLNPRDEDARANLQFANAQKQGKDHQEAPFWAVRWLRSFSGAPGLNFLTAVCSLFFVCMCAVGAVWIFQPHRALLWALLLVLPGLGLVGSGSLLAYKMYARNLPQAIVLAPKVVGRSGPGDDFLQVFVLYEGSKVMVERKEGVFVLVRLPGGIGGWLPADQVERI